MLLVVDNRDSFTFNLVQLFGRLGCESRVVQGESFDPREARRMSPRGVLLSPGPGRPEQARGSFAALNCFAEQVPVLGVCLGHQVICVAHDAEVVRASRMMHGRSSVIQHDGRGLFAGLSAAPKAARYHSLLVRTDSVRAPLDVCAWTEQGEVMAVRHQHRPIFGVQFHPESFLSEEGEQLAQNFLHEMDGSG